jgi:hypothetical protein
MSTPELLLEFALSRIGSMIGIIALVAIIFLILAGLINAFFYAGAIGMAKTATETGHTMLSDMLVYGKKSFISVFFADILIGLITLAGTIFIIPGLLYAPVNAIMQDLLSTGGLAAFILYVLIISIIFVAVRYAIVVDGVGALEGIKKGLSFFLNNKLDVLTIWIFIMMISLGLSIISGLMKGMPYATHVWSIIQIAVSLIVIEPLCIVWWTRLYVDRVYMGSR